MPLHITLTVIIYNEERLLERCIRSCEGVVDEILVIHDGPCSDRSMEIARSLGARTFERERRGFCEAHRPFALREARNDWILQLDADEYLSPELRQRIPQLPETGAAIYEAHSPFPIPEGGLQEGYYKRILYDRRQIQMLGLIHESVQPVLPTARVEHLEEILVHTPQCNNLSLDVFRTKIRRQTEAHARELLRNPSERDSYNRPAGGRLNRNDALRVRYPILMCIGLSIAYHTVHHTQLAIRKRSLFFLRMNRISSLYFAFLGVNLVREKYRCRQERRLQSRARGTVPITPRLTETPR